MAPHNPTSSVMTEYKFKSAFFPDVNLRAVVEAIELTDPLSPKLLKRGSPKVVSIQDVFWAGERMLEATLNPSQCPPVLVYFPLGTLSRQCYYAEGMLGMMEVAAEAGINTPAVLYCRQRPSLDVGRAMVMFLKDTNAQPLMEIWPQLCKARKEAVVKELASVMLKLYRYNVGSICTTRPFESIPPLPACPTSVSYFQSLTSQMHHLMHIAERNSNNQVLLRHGMGPLIEEERKAICDTWAKLSELIPYHSLPVYATAPVVGQPAIDYAMKLFVTERTGIHHDLDLPRLLVSFEGGNAKIIVGSGWEYSYHSPHWLVSRMPSWLVPEYSGPQMLPFMKQERLNICDSIYKHVQQESLDWIICYAFGIPNRYFENCLKSSWISRNSVERRLKLLQELWHSDHFYPFPITEQGTIVNVSHYREWVKQYYLKHPHKFMAIRDIWGNLIALPGNTILIHANPH